ncbi:MFS transporter [Carnobacteriaceae bacterium zg-ZUI252]|nr:MFS transporter [Carnobacteriaceae bacterium zg-ZUI252]MBS4769574.1 MFS transporter [Carnobacteriaceae bacterium zg-ZUI240]QTU83039.1 MFS transporter [Carnobacteriaceae bacterium zg-C25]
MTIRRIQQYFMVIQALSYFVFGMYLSNLTPFMASQGYSILQRGYALSSYAVLNIVLQQTFGYIADKTRSLKWIVLFSTFVFGTTSYLVLSNTLSTYWLLLVGVAISGGLLNSLCGLQDVWFIGIGTEMKNYLSPIKSFGSAGWGIGSLLSAVILSLVGYTGMSVILMVVSVIVCGVMWCVPDIMKKQHVIESDHKIDYRALFSNQSYLTLLGSLLLMYALIVVNTGLVVDKMLALQASAVDISLKWAMGSFLEIPAYVLVPLFMKRVHPLKLLKVSAIVLGIQFILFGTVQSPALIIGVSMLQLFTTPIVMVTSKLLIIDLVPEHLQNSAQLTALSVFMGGGSLIMPILAGTLATRFGIDMTLYVCVSFAAMAYYLLSKIKMTIE